ncbi:hypothetical protein RQP46_006523 [Phenoliferia psychrophenolica]
MGGQGATQGYESRPVGGGGADQFLNQANRLEITAEDRREGYDVDLLNAPARTGEANAAASDAEKGLAGTNGQRVSYPSRELEDPAARRRRHRQSKKNKVVKRAWYQTPWALLGLGIIIVAIALGVGLGVGLTQKDHDKSTGSSSSSTSQTSTTPIPNIPVTVSTSTATPAGPITLTPTSSAAAGRVRERMVVARQAA